MAPYNNVDDILRDLKSTSLVGPIQSWNAPAPVSSFHISPPDASGRPKVIAKISNTKTAADLPEIIGKTIEYANKHQTNVDINLDGCELGVKRPLQSEWTAFPYSVPLIPRTEPKPCRAKWRKMWLLLGIPLALGLDGILLMKTGWSVILIIIILFDLLFEKLFGLLSHLF